MIDEIAYDDSSMEELKHRANHWHDTAQMLKRQRDTAEEDRDCWKERALKAEQGRQVNRDLLVIAEGQRRTLRVERDALRKDAARLDWMESQKVFRASFHPLCFPPCWVVEASEVTSGETLRVALDAAMAVQP